MLFEVSGAGKLRRVARVLRETGDKGLRKELYAGLTRATRPFQDALISHLAAYLPSGYAPEVAATLKARASARGGQGARVRVTTTAGGRASKRDLSALDAGVLRHPVYGRYRFVKRSRRHRYRDVRTANPWTAQAIRPGFHGDRVGELASDATKECERVIDEIARKIEGGI